LRKFKYPCFIGTSVASIFATDADDGVNKVFNYAKISGDPSSMFSITGTPSSASVANIDATLVPIKQGYLNFRKLYNIRQRTHKLNSRKQNNHQQNTVLNIISRKQKIEQNEPA
jgi:hypothetical protein